MLFTNIMDTTISLRFNFKNNIGIEEYSYTLGTELFNFLSFDAYEVYALYIKMAEAFMDYHYGAKNESAYKEKLTALCGELDDHSIYLHPYTVDLLEHMTELQKGQEYVLDSYLVGQTVMMQDIFMRLPYLMSERRREPYYDIDYLKGYDVTPTADYLLGRPTYVELEKYKNEAKNLKTRAVSKAVMQNSIGLAVLFLVEDLKRKRAKYLDDISAIIDDDADLAGLSLTQKLYMLDVRREAQGENAVYSVDLWKTTFAPYPQIPSGMSCEEEVRDYILSNRIEIKQVHEIPNMDTLIIFELLTLLTSGANIKKCKYCGNFFVPQGRSDTVFCDRISKGETKPCRIIGSLKLHKAAQADNPIYEAHLKAYRRMNSKARTKRISQSEFLAWSDEARAKRDACLNRELEFGEFQRWLDAYKKK